MCNSHPTVLFNSFNIIVNTNNHLKLLCDFIYTLQNLSHIIKENLIDQYWNYLQERELA